MTTRTAPISALAHAVPAALLTTATGTASRFPRTHAGQVEALMEIAPSPLQHLSDSFSRAWLTTTTKRGGGGGARAPSFERLVAADAADFGSSSSRSSFIDMDPTELFSMRWMATGTAPVPPESDFDFGIVLPTGSGGGGGGSGSGSGPPSPVMVSASQVISNGRLLPSYPSVYQRSGVPDRAADPPSSPWSPLFRSASAPASPSQSPSSPTRSWSGGRRRDGGESSSWKMLLQYLRFLAPLYRKVRSLRRFPAAASRRRPPRVAPSSASPARASLSSSSVEWCHGNADTAVRDAILYCKKSSGQADGYTSLT